MNRTIAIVAATILLAGTGYAQTSAGAQAGASAQGGADVNTSAGRSGGQASAGTAAGTSSSASSNGSLNKAGGATLNTAAANSVNGSANTAANAAGNHGALAEGSTMNATLSNMLDAKKSKAGDQVTARTTSDVKQDGKVIVPKGSHLVGHVTQVQERDKASTQSSLGVVFDRADLRNGQQVPLNMGIQALAVSQAATEASADDGLSGLGGGSAMGGARVGGGGLVRGTTGSVTNVAGSVGSTAGNAGGAVNGAAGVATRSTGAVGGLNASGVLASNSQGVFGLEGLSLQGAASNATQGSVIVSQTKNVHLASGTQMLLRAGAQ